MNKKLYHITLALVSLSCNNSDTSNSNILKQHDSEKHIQNTDSSLFHLGTNERINTKQPKISLKKMFVNDNLLSIYLPVDFRPLNVKQEAIPYFGNQDCIEKYGNQNATVSFSICRTKKRITEDELDTYVMMASDTLGIVNENVSDITLSDASFDELTIRTVGFYFWINGGYTYYRIGFTVLENQLVLFIFKADGDESEFSKQTAEMVFRSIKNKRTVEYGDKDFSF